VVKHSDREILTGGRDSSMSAVWKTRTKRMTRRSFMSGVGAAAFSFTIVKPGSVSGTQANSRIEAGMMCGNC